MVLELEIFFVFGTQSQENIKKIRESPIELEDFILYINALCYDHKNDDYKFAIGVKHFGSWGSTLVQVYTLSSNSWKTKKTITNWFRAETAGVLVNGDLHWLVTAPSNSVIMLSLNISDESFNKMQLPEGLPEKKINLSMDLGVLRGCLCALSRYINVKIGFEVWEMLDYGVCHCPSKNGSFAHNS
ncbi:F-box protein CPR1-like [Papaver somniferum]|uniref:F-box protein CPR1-like n=1 Tax=Papaver somniferum TaxID=3469 RepID=UPI000E700631|nr:F-box protein CPR1-like [Papaver somniferum]